MKASETVMPLEYSVLDSLHCAGISDEKILCALTEQAEISFKAGYEAAVAECLGDMAYDQIKRAGIKEVVESILSIIENPKSRNRTISEIAKYCESVLGNTTSFVV